MVSIDSLTKAIEKAGEDPNVEGIVVHMGVCKPMNGYQLMHQLSASLRSFSQVRLSDGWAEGCPVS